MSAWYKISSLSLLILLASSALAQVNFKASANRDHVGQNERFKVEFVLNAEGENFNPPSFDNFRVLGGPNRSTSMRIINYERSVENTYSFFLMAEQPGTYTIGRASIKAEGKTYYSDPIKIKVSSESPRASDPNDPYSIASRKAFFKVIASKTQLYLGEPLVASYKLYFSRDVKVSRPQVIEEPSFQGFYKSDLEINRIPTSKESYRGETYQSGIFEQMVLIPQQIGTIRPGSVQAQIPTQVPTNRTDIFGRRLSRTVNQSASEQFPAIEVKPLPERGKPSGFSGAVGDFDFDVSVSRSELTANESLTLKVRLSGRGNIKLVEAPEPEIPSAFEAYDPKYSEDIRVNASGMSGSKTYEYLLVPRYGGTYKIPEIQFSYFDTRQERYKTITTDELKVTVTGGKPQPGQNEKTPTVAGKEEVDFISKDILYIKTSSEDFQEVGESFITSTTFYSLLGGLGLAWAGMIGFFFFSTNRQKDQRRIRSKKAGRKARKQLSQARKALNKNDTEGFYQALSAALWGYFADKFNIPQSRLTKEAIEERLTAKGLDEYSIEEVIESINRAEMARYTSAGSKNPEQDYEQAARLLTQIENNL